MVHGTAEKVSASEAWSDTCTLIAECHLPGNCNAACNVLSETWLNSDFDVADRALLPFQPMMIMTASPILASKTSTQEATICVSVEDDVS